MDPKDAQRQHIEDFVRAIIEERKSGSGAALPKFPLSEKKFMDVATDIALASFALGISYATNELPTIEHVKNIISGWITQPAQSADEPKEAE